LVLEVEDADLAEFLVEAHVLHELLAFRVAEHKAPVHHPREAVVDGRLALE